MKTIGIVADNYKVERFKNELKKAGYDDFSLSPFTSESTTIKVKVSEDKMFDIKRICESVELHFKRSN